MAAYYQFLKRDISEDCVTAYYRSTKHAQGAWNEHEQHMAPASGLMVAELEQFSPRQDMRIGRISFDIFGLIPFGDFRIQTKTIRQGKTIELVESEMIANDRICIVARVWRMLIQDSTEVAGLEDHAIAQPDQYQKWDGMSKWPGGFIQTLDARSDENHRAGKGVVWLNNDLEMIEGKETSDFVHLMGMVDTANGVAPRLGETFSWAFPNLDLQIHLYRKPRGRWLGFETVQQFGQDGIGLTSSILHDENGPFGRSEQILTLRKLS